jgi:peptidoglycan/LPS O-acetylase OafA/YrhL
MMWGRISEIALGAWLAVSPLVFQSSPRELSSWIHGPGCAVAIVSLALLSFCRRLDKIHLLNAAVALWLLAFAFLTRTVPVSPAAQNQVVVALLLLMLAVVPNRSSQPPQKWRSFMESKSRDAGAS